MSISVVLMDRGHRLTTGINVDNDTATAVYWTASARPDLTPTTLPEFGDSWMDPINGAYPSLTLETVDRAPIVDDHTIGYEYICTYRRESAATWKPLDDPASFISNVPSINSSGEFDSWEYAGTTTSFVSGATATSLYFAPSSGASPEIIIDPKTIHRMTCIINLSVTSKQAGTFTSMLNDLYEYTGKINNSSWNGVGVGNVLCTGGTLTPLADITAGVKSIKYMRTLNFSIKAVPGGSTYNWDRVFHNGNYGLLYTDKDGNDQIHLYETASLPEDIT